MHGRFEQIGEVGIFAVLGIALNHAAFAVNNISDLDQDRMHPKRRLSPLVSGVLRTRDAWISVAIVLLLSLGLYFIFTKNNIFSVGALIGLFLFTCSVSYYQKRAKSPLFMDILYSLVFVFCLNFAALPDGYSDINPAVGVSVAMAALALQMNQCGNLKDLEQDRQTRFQTIALQFGVKIKSGRLQATPSFAIYSWILQAAFFAAIFSLLGLVPHMPERLLLATAVCMVALASCLVLYRLLKGVTNVSLRGLEAYLILNCLLFVAFSLLVISKGILSALILSLLLIGPLVFRAALTRPARVSRV